MYKNSPIFSNSCGKLYPNKIVLASANKETTHPLQSISKLTFRKSFETSSFLFMLLPCALFIFPRFLNSDENFIKLFLYSLGALMLVLSIVMGKKKYSLTMHLVNGTKRSVRVWEGNTKEAQKFVTQANALCASKNTVTTQPQHNDVPMHIVTETRVA